MRKLVIALLVLVGLGVAADYAAAVVAEYQVEQQMREELSVESDPKVRINGFPFLPQALLGHYLSIEMRAAGVSVGPLQDVSIEATMREVDAPLSEVTAGQFGSVRASEVEGGIRIKDTDLGRAIGLNDLRIQPASHEEIDEFLPTEDLPGRKVPAGSDIEIEPSDRAGLRLVATTNLAGERTEIVGTGLIRLTGNQVRITTVDVRLSRDDVGEVSLPAPVLQPLMQELSFEVQPGGLPFDVTPTRVWVENGSFVVEGLAEEVTMNQLGAGIE